MSTELVRLLAELSVLYPDMRLGQLVEMLASLAEDAPPADGRDSLLASVGKSHLQRRLVQLGRSEQGLDGEGLPAARADLLAALRGAGPGAEAVLGVWARLAGTRLYDAEDEALLAAARPPIRLGDWFSRQALVGGAAAS